MKAFTMDLRGFRLMFVLCILGACLDLTTCKVCRGTRNGLSTHGTADHVYQTLIERYTNCTLVDGNLEITFLNEVDNYDLSFLSTIREITGYLLIVGNHAEVLPMSSLRIIRGHPLYTQMGNSNNTQAQQYSFLISRNYGETSGKIGFKKLELTSLREITNGDVFVKDNKWLCNVDTILWQDIVRGENAEIMFDQNITRDHCQPCHSACEPYPQPGQDQGKRFCWGPTKHECQVWTWLVCNPSCEARCFGRQHHECCHPECVAGCTGPGRKDCWACKHFKNEDRCVEYCPSPTIYDQNLYKNIINPKGKYSYGTICVKECPNYLLEDQAACVKGCDHKKYAKDGRCIACEGPCPKSCNGFQGDSFLYHEDLDRFKGCTIIKGNLEILQTSFDGDNKGSGIHPANLSVFNEVQEITGYVNLQGKNSEFLSGNFLPKLHTIYGRHLHNNKWSLAIVGTSFTKIGLVSLQTIKFGDVVIHGNPDLCYIEGMNWTSILPLSTQSVKMAKNRMDDQCMRNGFVCDGQCSKVGCWGPSPIECLSCENYKLGNKCIEYCNHLDNRYVGGNNTCHPCHEECASTCHGEGNSNCDECKHVKDGPFCLKTCPESKYKNESLACQPCHDNCEGGCTGPNNTVGQGACKSCTLSQVDEDWNIEGCLPDSNTCQDGYYRSSFPSKGNYTLAGKREACRKCNSLCKTCNGPGVRYCLTCQKFKQDQICVDSCYIDYYAANVTERNHLISKCFKCDRQCQWCNGPNVTDCIHCRGNKVLFDTPTTHENDVNNTPKFYCVDTCPDEKPYRRSQSGPGNQRETVCVQDDPIVSKSKMKNDETGWIIGGTVVFFVIIVIIIVGALMLRRHKNEKTKLEMAARFSGEEGEPLTPGNASPDMAVMRLITESELRKGNIIGSGAFGTVYKGMWVPVNENIKIPVAIKVLQESTTPSQNKELLEEARVMASVNHPYCVRILAVCMTAQMMLITQLMPFGCLLEYVRKNRSNIGSKVLLNWCTQIAKGMTYLENQGVVHRDLAARNVLIQNPSNIKITDFGLAKLLDLNQDEYKSSGGKMPIKWLALECIQHRIFTHKSDVWSYGVTVWELFTYGQKPYETLRARDVPDLLEKGERLPQPSICTIDVYMIMIKCWMLDAESRPGFKELAEEFSKMARDPGRYLVIQGDKLMRLPSQTYNQVELMHSMSIAEEGNEEIMDAEDYLQPTVTQPPTNGVVEKIRESNGYDNDRDLHVALGPDVQSGCSNTYQLPNHMKPGANGPIPPWSKKAGVKAGTDPHSSRYSPDPCNVFFNPKEGEGQIVGLPPLLQSCSEDDRLRMGKPSLPVIGEDDYLQPRSSKPSQYMDLIEDYPQDNQYLEPQAPSAMDNPEYFQNVPRQDVDLGIDSLKTHKPEPRLRSPSDESTASSEAEYYNECDRLNYPRGNRGGGPILLTSPVKSESVV